MGCKYCSCLGTDNDGSDYPTDSWFVCNAEMTVANLKGFPFKRVPKPCRKNFRIDPWRMPICERDWWAASLLCDDLCRKAGLDSEHKIRCRECDALRYVVGRTDIPLSDREQIVQILSKMKFKNFELAEYVICPECEGVGTWSGKEYSPYGYKICYRCNATGRLQTNRPAVKNKIINATCKTCNESRIINRVYIDERNGKHTLYCYSCKKEHDIQNFKLVTEYVGEGKQ